MPAVKSLRPVGLPNRGDASAGPPPFEHGGSTGQSRFSSPEAGWTVACAPLGALLECENAGGRFTNRPSGDSHRTLRPTARPVASCGLAARPPANRRMRPVGGVRIAQGSREGRRGDRPCDRHRAGACGRVVAVAWVRGGTVPTCRRRGTGQRGPKGVISPPVRSGVQQASWRQAHRKSILMPIIWTCNSHVCDARQHSQPSHPSRFAIRRCRVDTL